MLRSITELAAYGLFAVLLTAASLAPETGNAASSASIDRDKVNEHSSNPTSDRGAFLFAVKGCVGCHMHASLPNARMQVGPDLTHVADRAATRVPGLDARGYVRQSLMEPQAFRVVGYEARMPDLQLTDDEIESLSVFLLSPTR